MAAMSADPAKSLGGGGFWAAGCWANPAVESSVKIVQNIRTRIEDLLRAEFTRLGNEASSKIPVRRPPSPPKSANRLPFGNPGARAQTWRHQPAAISFRPQLTADDREPNTD